MTQKEIDLLNVILIVVSLFFAFQYPFELFFFSFIVLGPLHYLTEIHWLKEKNYFVKSQQWIWVFVLIAFVITLPILMRFEIIKDAFEKIGVKPLFIWLNKQFGYLLLFSLLFSIGLVQLASKVKLLLYLMLSIAFSILILKVNKTILLIATFLLSSLIHVYLFTLLFMTFGYLNHKTFWGKIALLALLICPIIIAVSKMSPMNSNDLSPYIKESVYSSGIGQLIVKVAELFDLKKTQSFNLLSPIALKIQTFIAFAYTYHYLNWFSKTSIIGWSKNLSKAKTYFIISIWIGILLLYRYNFNYGLVLLFFFSTLHVLLEFPLNITTIKMLIRFNKK